MKGKKKGKNTQNTAHPPKWNVISIPHRKRGRLFATMGPFIPGKTRTEKTHKKNSSY